MSAEKFIAWAAWHPKRGFADPFSYEGAVAFADLDGAVERVKILNADEGTNNRTGWRAVKVELVKVTA